MPDDMHIILVTRRIVEWLVEGNYQAIERYSKGIRCSAEEIAEAIDEYGRQLMMPPESTFDDLDVIEVENAVPRTWSVIIDLWTKEEGRSDLSLELTLMDKGNEELAAEVDNIHVL